MKRTAVHSTIIVYCNEVGAKSLYESLIRSLPYKYTIKYTMIQVNMYKSP